VGKLLLAVKAGKAENSLKGLDGKVIGADVPLISARGMAIPAYEVIL
jgi:hypothetical protein